MATVNSYTGSVPTPSRTTLEEIVAAARDQLEVSGVPGLTMQSVAERVGVRAPSLYKHVADRDELVRLVAEATVAELGARLSGASLAELASGFRSFAHERPVAFQLVQSPGLKLTDSLNTAVAPLLAATAALDPDHALEAARTVTAWANGFISMELAGAFQLGGDVEEAWTYGLSRITAAISGPAV